jgi:hypothetical protein
LTGKGQEGGNLQEWVEKNPGRRTELDSIEYRVGRVKPFGITLAEKGNPQSTETAGMRQRGDEWIVTTNV